MQTLGRTKQPDIKIISKIKLTNPESITLDNGVPLYSFNAGTQEVIKIECVFDAGTWYQDKKLVAFSTLKMLTEGTKKYSASVLAELFDSYGAFIETEVDKDCTSISLYSLNKNLENLLPVFAEMIRESIFPQHELSVLLSNTKQDQLVLMQRVNYLAHVKFAEQLFGKDHPYGQKASIEDYDKVVPADLINFHKNYYHPSNLRIIISGKVEDKVVALINKHLGNKGWTAGNKTETKTYKILPCSEKSIFIPKENALQSGIRVGKLLFTKKHPDYIGLSVLNTILGGYFGSRLMKNIREEKGYTYGIGSGMLSLKNGGYMYIASEVGADVREKAIKEIYKEITRLVKEPISEKELNLVRSYMIGSFMRSIDGPFALAEQFLNILDYKFDFVDYYNKYIKIIKEITPLQLTALAEKYFNADTFYETIAGK